MSAKLLLRSDSAATTERFGAALGRALRPGDLVVLNGDLGAGKTCLARGIVAGAGGDPGAVRSPTFVLQQPHAGSAMTIQHADLYRLGPGAVTDVLDIDGALADGAVLVEWGEYADLAAYSPATVAIRGEGPGPDDRTLRLLEAPAHLADAWVDLAVTR